MVEAAAEKGSTLSPQDRASYRKALKLVSVLKRELHDV